MTVIHDVLARWQPMPTDEIRTEIDQQIAEQPADAARLLLWLVLDRQIQAEGLATERRRATDAIFEASRYRLLWNSAAACLANLKKLPRPRGGDERRMLAHIHTAHGPISAGSTDGWLDWLPNPDTEARRTPTTGGVVSLFDPEAAT